MTQDNSLPYQPPIAAWRPTQTVVPAATVPSLVERLPDRVAARAIVATVAAAFIAQLLFVRQQPGLNFPIWVVAVVGAAFALRRPGARIDRADLWLPAGALAFSTFIAIRADIGLLLFDVLASMSLTLASAVAIGGHAVSRATWSRIVSLGSAAVAIAWVGAAALGHGFRPLARALPLRSGGSAGPVVRGVLIAIPLVIVFALLFSAADAVFLAYLRGVVDVRLNGPEVVARTVFALLAGWLFAGTVAAAWLSRDRFPQPQQAAADAPAEGTRARLGTTETMIVLVALDIVFAFFVAIQGAYLFPGADPLAVSGLTYAEYARRGFFELVATAMLAGLVIVVLDALISNPTRAYRLAAGALAALTGVVLISAAARLGLYQEVYGWTELRFYVLTAIVWLAIGLIATLATLYLRRVSVLPKFMIGAGLAVALACNVIGPQAFVTSQNLQRVIDPTLVPADGYAGLDVDYLGYLGADSVLVVVDSLPQLPPAEAQALEDRLAGQASELRRAASELGWPSWNFARQRALDTLTALGY